MKSKYIAVIYMGYTRTSPSEPTGCLGVPQFIYDNSLADYIPCEQSLCLLFI